MTVQAGINFKVDNYNENSNSLPPPVGQSVSKPRTLTVGVWLFDFSREISVANLISRSLSSSQIGLIHTNALAGVRVVVDLVADSLFSKSFRFSCSPRGIGGKQN